MSVFTKKSPKPDSPLLFEAQPASIPPPVRGKINKTSELVSNFCYVGVEVELEEVQSELVENVLEDFDPKGTWGVKRDGSLRGNWPLEFFFMRPLRGKDVLDSLNILEKAIDTAIEGNKVSASYRTGVHVHVDVRNFTRNQIFNLVFLNLLYEDLLYSYCGKHRKENNFCVPNNSSEFYKIINFCNRLFKDPISGRSANDNLKYSGINYYSIGRRGSVEYRQHPGTYQAKEISRWINVLQRLWLQARRLDSNHHKVLEHISILGPHQFTKQLFGKEFSILEPHFNDNDLLIGIRNAQLFTSLLKHSNTKSPMFMNTSNPQADTSSSVAKIYGKSVA